MSPFRDLPLLDCHAHIAPDVTAAQLATLRGAFVFAVTRDLTEARAVQQRHDPTLVWGVGAHPGVRAALDEYEPSEFRRLVARTALVGEVGMDARGSRTHQRDVLSSILQECQGQPVMISIHSTGRTAEVVDILAGNPHPGAILHWFLGTPEQIDEAAALGAYFSVNAAMSSEVIAAMPADRLLPETDFPSARRSTQAKVPGDVSPLERRLSDALGGTPAQWRERWYQNLSDLLKASEAHTRLLPPLVERLTLP